MSEDRDALDDAPEDDLDIDLQELDDDLPDDDDPDADPDDGPDDEEPEPRKPTRGESRVATLAAERATERARADSLERELAAERANKGQQSQAEAQRQRNEHLATLSGDARTEFLLREQGQATQAALNEIRFNNYDNSDKAAFSTLVARTPALKGLEAEVEERLALLRKDGGNIAREAVAKFLLGEKAMAKATRANNAGDKRAAVGRERQTARPTNGRSDVAVNRGRAGRDDNSLEAIKKRLAGVRI